MAYVRTRLGRLFYEERGDSRRPADPPIVLLHGLLFDGGMWRAQVEPLSALGRVIVIDGPGHGKSEPGPRFTLEEHADALVDAFFELGVRRAVVVGLSWGGMVAMRLALQHPSKIAGLALLDTSAEVEPIANRIKYRAFVAVHRRVGIPYALFEREIAPLMYGSRTLVDRPELLEATYRRAMGFDRDGIARAALAVMVHRKSILSELARVRAETLVICGAEDRATPRERSEAIASGIPGAKLVMIPGAGHMTALEDADAVNGHLVPFVGNCIADADR